jgi:PHD/YefM family antitoxin component YafN of YafNO toxin-antitoxin module
MRTAGAAKTVKKVSASEFRDHFRDYAEKARGDKVVLVENRRREPKYLVDKIWFDALMRERESVLATLEILADRNLTNRLLRLAQTIDADVRAGRLHTIEDVFDKP